PGRQGPHGPPQSMSISPSSSWPLLHGSTAPVPVVAEAPPPPCPPPPPAAAVDELSAGSSSQTYVQSRASTAANAAACTAESRSASSAIIGAYQPRACGDESADQTTGASVDG